MALQTLNTIQGGVQTTYGDTYYKQALSNLGQRVGARGDSIINQSFTLADIKNANVNMDDVNYIVVSYDSASGDMTCIYNDDVLNTNNSNLFASLSITDVVEIHNIPIVEYISNTWNDLNDVRIFKNHANNSYFVLGLCVNAQGTVTEILAIEFPENSNTILNSVSITVDASFISYVIATSDNNNVNIQSNCKYKIVNSTNRTFDNIYSDISDLTDVDSIIEYLTSGVTVTPDSNIDVQYFKTKFEYYINILPSYAKNLYNEAVYFSDNSYKGLKKYIIREFVKALYNDSGFDTTDNIPFVVYFNKDYAFTCLVNSSTNGIYVSYDILVNFLSSDIDTDDLRTVVAKSNVLDRIIAYKFYVTYLDNDRIIDDILVNKLYVLPYIKENVHHENVWVINDEETDIRTSGKDAGNPNILMMSYIKTTNGEQVSYSTNNGVSIEVLHTYNETSTGVSFKDLLLQYTESDGIEKSFNYALPEFVYPNNEGFFEFNITLPNINRIIEENAVFESILKNTLLMTFVDLKLSDDERQVASGDYYTLHEMLHGENNTTQVSYITVYWNIIQLDDDTYDWNPIVNPAFGLNSTEGSNLPVLDLGSMFSFTDFVDYYVHSLMTPDEYLYSWIVFDPINAVLKNQDPTNTQTNAADDLIHLVLKPDTSLYYSQTINGTVSYNQYKNNLNFAPKFLKASQLNADNTTTIDIIQYKDNSTGEILNINDTPTNYSAINKFFSLQNNKVTDISKVNNDFIPNSDDHNKYPMFDFREMLTMNQTQLNRLNIMSVAPDKRVYNAYFGHNNLDSTSYDYDVLAIGSTQTNHNMNSNITLTDSAESFNVYDRIRFDLPVFHTKPAVFDKIVLKKMQNEFMYYAVISVSNSHIEYIRPYTFTVDNSTISNTIVTKKTKYMQSSPASTSANSLTSSDDNKYYCKTYSAFNAAKYLNTMDSYGIVTIDDPEYPRLGNGTFKNDGYILVKIPETLNTAGQGTPSPFENVKMLSGFDTLLGDTPYESGVNKNTYSTFICYFEDVSRTNDTNYSAYGQKMVGETGYKKHKHWLKLVNIQEIVTGSKYIQ